MPFDEAYFTFLAVKGIQANKEYFVSMVPLSTIPKLFVFTDEELPPEVRAQRKLNKSRIPEMKRYILENPNSYVFSSLTVSVDSDISFKAVSDSHPCIGEITIPMDAKFLVNDGQHRKAAIEAALKENPKLKYEHISVVFYHDLGLKHSQQMFSDLNRYAIRPTKSLNILYDDRDALSIIVRGIAQEAPFFKDLVEMEKTTISNRSKSLFTLSAIYHGTEALLKDFEGNKEDAKSLAYRYWNEVSNYIPQWEAVCRGVMKASEVRRDYICSLSVTFLALGIAGNKLVKTLPDTWAERMAKLRDIDWSKKSEEWTDLVVVNDKVVSSKTTEVNLARYLERILLNGR